MGCCANKKCDRPKEEMLSPEAVISLLEDSSWAVTKLLEIAKSGIRFVGFKNDRVNELAATISAIVAENNYLKGLLGIFHPSKTQVNEKGVTIMFGPGNAYTLFIPAVTDDARQKIAASLTATAMQLKQKKATPDPRQQEFSFDQ
jgi:hypothetical protein